MDTRKNDRSVPYKKIYARPEFVLLLLVIPGRILTSALIGLTGVESTVLTIPYRALVLGLSLYIILLKPIRLFRINKNPWAFLLLLFLLVGTLKAFTLTVYGTSSLMLLNEWLFIVVIPSVALASKYIYTYLRLYVTFVAYVLLVALLALTIMWGFELVPSGRGGSGVLSVYSLNNNLLGRYAVIGAGWFLLIATQNLDRRKTKSVLFHVICFFGCSFITIATGSMSAIFALCAISVILFLASVYHTKERLSIVIYAIVVAAVIVVVNDKLFLEVSAFRNVYDVIDLKVSVRMNMISQAVQGFVDNPLVGAGYYITHPTLERPTYTHNLLVGSYFTLGLIGGTLFVVMWLACIFKGLKFIMSAHKMAFLSVPVVTLGVVHLASGGILNANTLFYFVVPFISFIRGTTTVRPRRS